MAPITSGRDRTTPAPPAAPAAVRRVTSTERVLREHWGMNWIRTSGGAQTACSHVPGTLAAPSGGRCEACGSRSSLRMCATCGHVGCCESQAGHARAHALAEHHPVIVSLPVGEGFTWCYEENAYVG